MSILSSVSSLSSMSSSSLLNIFSALLNSWILPRLALHEIVLSPVVNVIFLISNFAVVL